MTTFSIGDTDFLLDGAPHRVLAGAIHYFRVHPDQWRDRIRKAKLMGLNTVETYIAWNAHAPQRDVFDLTGGLDLGRFLDIVAEEGMHAIVRPGPYICAEWDNGGLPAWLFQDPEVGVRTSEPKYLAAVEQYLNHVLPIVAERQITRGGPVILVQIENEYGAYGSDKDYLRELIRINRAAGIDVPFTTVDQPTDQMLENGSLPELHRTGSFGSRSAERLATLRRHQSTGPLMCSEFWDGWFDWWGSHHATTPVEQTAADLDELLSLGASVSIYMFVGGTNFGFTNGANDKGVYQPTITSYDYDAPLDETGAPTAKFWAFRDVIAKYAAVPEEVPQASATPAPAFEVSLTHGLPLWNAIEPVWSPATDQPVTTDSQDWYSGFSLYRATVDGEGPSVLQVGEIRDRADVFLNRTRVGTLQRDHHDRTLTLPEGANGVLEFLVEDQGRVNYGVKIGEPKGLIGPVAVSDAELGGWQFAPVPLDEIAEIESKLAEAPLGVAGTIGAPAFLSATFTLDSPVDLFLATGALGKGVAWVNGFNLGRYWTRGPQHTLYVPASALVAGSNTITVLELVGHDGGPLEFVEHADLGHTEF